MAKLLDANLALRYFLNDLPEQAKAVEELVKKTEVKLVLTDLVVAEIVWVFQSTYKLERFDIANKIKALINLKCIESNKTLLEKTLIYYVEYNISFIDAYLAAFNEQYKLEGIYSFDKGLDKIKGVKRFKP